MKVDADQRLGNTGLQHCQRGECVRCGTKLVRSTPQWSRSRTGPLCEELLLQHPNLIQQVASAVQRELLVSCAQCLKMMTIRERPVQFNPKIRGNWTEWQKSAVVVHVELTFGLSVVQVKGRRHRFCMAEL